MNRFHDRTIEQEKIEKRRQLPYHMHFNLELLESIFLVCCIFIEVPKMTGSKIHQSRIYSKSFTKLIDIYEQQTFNGPAENVRETLMSATSSLVCGDWRQATEVNFESGKLGIPTMRQRCSLELCNSTSQRGRASYFFTSVCGTICICKFPSLG